MVLASAPLSPLQSKVYKAHCDVAVFSTKGQKVRPYGRECMNICRVTTEGKVSAGKTTGNTFHPGEAVNSHFPSNQVEAISAVY